VIIEETGYVHRIADTIILPGVPAAIRRLNTLHIPTVVVTNQAGIARRLYTWDDFHLVQNYIEAELALSQASFDGVWACACHPDGLGPLACDHPFRKPNPGMLLDAALKMNLDLSRSWLIGDKTIDIDAAIAAGLRGAILVRTGYGRQMESRLRQPEAGQGTRVLACDDLAEAIGVILQPPQL